MPVVPGTGTPGVSGRVLLGSLMATHVLFPPPCFDSADPSGDCGPAVRLALPLRYWPLLGSGTPDLVLDRQIGQRGQCQHFMAQTNDGLAPLDAKLGVPGALATTAYVRCMHVAALVFDGILRDPLAAQRRIAGTYVLMHAFEDSFSAAHVNRDGQGKVVHLLSWTLIDWPRYVLRGAHSLGASTHHAVVDDRDEEYLQRELRTPEGNACTSFNHPYAVPELCLTDRAKAAVDAVVAYLVMTYVLRARAATRARTASLFVPAQGDEGSAWLAFVHDHMSSVAATADLAIEPRSPLPRPDLFLGVLGGGGRNHWSVGAWGTRIFYVRPTIPFALGLTAFAGFARSDGAGQLAGGGGVNLLLPLVRRFTIGASPAGVRLVCDTAFHSCSPDLGATLGFLLIPLGDAMWVALEGPQWSWTARAVGNTWIGLALGWSRELTSHPQTPSDTAITTWDPPRPAEVSAYRMTRSTRALYLAATAGGEPDQAYVGFGLDWRRDRDRWNRRTGLVPGLQLEVDAGGQVEGTRIGGVALAPMLRAYLIADRVALTATPALLRAGVFSRRGLGFDVAARAGLAVHVGNVELGVDSFPLSYLPDGQRKALPLTARLGVLLD